MDLQERSTFIVSFLYFAALGALCYIALKILLPLMAPFIAAFMIAAALNPLVTFLEGPLKGRNRAAAAVLLLFYGCAAGVIFLFGSRLTLSLQEQAKKLPGFYTQVAEPGLTRLFCYMEEHLPIHGMRISTLGQNLERSLESALGAFSSELLGWSASVLSSFPSAVLNLLVTVIASFFLASDYNETSGFILRQFSKGKRSLILAAYSTVKEVAAGLVKAYAALMFITFCELAAGFFILGVPMMWTAAFVITLVDILPVLGTGTILIPWAFIAWITGTKSLSFGLICLYLLITVVRQILEPKFLGGQIGLSPVAVLLCLFAGGRLLGLPGIFLFPIGAAVIKTLNEKGVIQLIK